MNRKKWLIASLVGVSIISALFDGLFVWRGLPSTPSTTALADVLLVLLLAMWVDTDSRDRPKIARPFDYGYLVLIYWLPYLPYYLWRTRGAAGLLLLTGFLSLFAMGVFVQLLVYLFYYLYR